MDYAPRHACLRYYPPADGYLPRHARPAVRWPYAAVGTAAVLVMLGASLWR
jgi:hypothetical protein